MNIEAPVGANQELDFYRESLDQLTAEGFVPVIADDETFMGKMGTWMDNVSDKWQNTAATVSFHTSGIIPSRRNLRRAVVLPVVALLVACGESGNTDTVDTSTTQVAQSGGFGGVNTGGGKPEASVVTVVPQPTETVQPSPTETHTPTPSPIPTETPTPSPTATATEVPPTKIPEPTATPELSLEQKIIEKLPYKLAPEMTVFTKESGELQYLPSITIAVDNVLTNSDGECKFKAVDGTCLSINGVSVNPASFPGISPEEARRLAAQRLEEAVLISYTYALHFQDSKYESLTVEDLKSLIDQGNAPDLIIPKTTNSLSIVPKEDSVIKPIENGLWFVLTGPGHAGKLSFSQGFYIGIREEEQTGIIEMTSTDLFNVNNPERIGTRLSSGIFRGLQFMSDYPVIEANEAVTIDRLYYEAEQLGGYIMKNLLYPITEPSNEGVLIPNP